MILESLNMQDIRAHLLPAFIAGYIVTALIHMLGLLLLLKVKFQPANQRTIIIHLSCAELNINLFQALVYILLMLGQCDSDSICSFFDQFFYVFLSGANKLIMIYLMCDRMLDIHLHMKYFLYFSENRVRKILICLWIFCSIFSLATVLLRKFRQGAEGIVIFIFFIGTDITIILAALMTYLFLYNKVRRFRKCDRRQRTVIKRHSDFKRFQRSKFLLPSLIIATYLLFNTTGDVVVVYKTVFLNASKETEALLSEIGHLLWILGWISDGILYIFLQRSIRQRLWVLCHKKQTFSIPAVIVSQYEPSNQTISTQGL